MTEVEKDLKAIKQLLVLQLIYSGVPIPDVVKAAGMSNSTLYTFISKNTSVKARRKRNISNSIQNVEISNNVEEGER